MRGTPAALGSVPKMKEGCVIHRTPAAAIKSPAKSSAETHFRCKISVNAGVNTIPLASNDAKSPVTMMSNVKCKNSVKRGVSSISFAANDAK